MDQKNEIIVPDGMELSDGEYVIVSLITNHVVYRCATPDQIEEWLNSRIDGHPYVGYCLEGRTLKLVALRFRVWESEVEVLEETMITQ